MAFLTASRSFQEHALALAFVVDGSWQVKRVKELQNETFLEQDRCSQRKAGAKITELNSARNWGFWIGGPFVEPKG
jgi:hypothetical protein